MILVKVAQKCDRAILFADSFLTTKIYMNHLLY